MRDVEQHLVEGFDFDYEVVCSRVALSVVVNKQPIAALIQSFVDAQEAALARPDGQPSLLSRWGDWLVMAATLTQLRCRLLLPADAAEAKAALSEAEALRRQLVGRERCEPQPTGSKRGRNWAARFLPAGGRKGR